MEAKMQARLTTKPAQQVISAIQGLDLEPVKLRVMDPKLGEGWTREYADSIEIAYKNYLTMLVKYQDDAEDILLAEDVDEFWHTHILQTIKYADDCQSVFGNFLHHSPHVGEVSQADLEERDEKAEKTRQLYQREFGSAQHAEAAWNGNAIKAGNAAMSNVAFRTDSAAMSNVAIRAGNAAMSNVAIRADNAAMSNMAIRAAHAAMSNVAIRAGNAAMSNVAIRADNAAMSNVAIRAGNAAMSNVAIRSNSAHMPTAAMRA
jgi:hypothetical protein